MSSACFAAAPRLPNVLHAQYFTVHYKSADPFGAKLVADTAKEDLLRISRDLGYVPNRNQPFTLNIYSSHYDFIEAGGLDIRKFTVGTARSSDQSISVDASGVFVATEQVIAHEITHAVIFRILGSSSSELPLWMNEGLAKYESDDFSSGDSELVANAAANGDIIPLHRLKIDFPDNQSPLAYAESASAVKYLVKISGNSTPKAYLMEIARGGTSDAAMEKAAGRSEGSFENAWMSSMGGRYGTLRFTTIVGSILSVVMALLAVAAFLMRRKQKIEAARQWEEEEFDNYMRKEFGNWQR